IFDDMPILHDENAREAERFADVMRNAEHRGAAPQLTSSRQQVSTLFALQTPEWFIENDQPNSRPQQRAAKANRLAFAAAHHRSAPAERRLQTVRQLWKYAHEIRCLQHASRTLAHAVRRSVTEIFDERFVPEMNTRIDPRDFGAQTIERQLIERLSIDTNHS